MDISPLFTPFAFGELALPNRFIMPAMQRELSPDGVPSAEMADYYRRRVEGGVSLVIGEATAVDHPTSTQYFKYARFSGPSLPAWRRVLDAVKGAGGRLIIQLWHQGAMRQEGIGPYPDVRTVSPSERVQANEPVGREQP